MTGPVLRKLNMNFLHFLHSVQGMGLPSLSRWHHLACPQAHMSFKMFISVESYHQPDDDDDGDDIRPRMRTEVSEDVERLEILDVHRLSLFLVHVISYA
jgi:hypothetical protein